jgi:hypothetical protein
MNNALKIKALEDLLEMLQSMPEAEAPKPEEKPEGVIVAVGKPEDEKLKDC